MTLDRIEGLLLDMDGVLTVSWRPLAGAPQALACLRAAGMPVRVVTSTTARSRPELVAGLASAGFDFAEHEVLGASTLAADHLREAWPGARVFLLGDARPEDLAGVRLVGLDDAPDVILVSGADESFAFATLTRVYRALLGGTALVAMHRNLAWMTDDGLNLDAGAYLLGLEHASGREAVVTGKPAAACFSAAVRTLGLTPERVAMVGDDVLTDVLAAQAAGLAGVLVRTGKFREEQLAAAPGRPDHVIDAFADLPELLGL